MARMEGNEKLTRKHGVGGVSGQDHFSFVPTINWRTIEKLPKFQIFRNAVVSNRQYQSGVQESLDFGMCHAPAHSYQVWMEIFVFIEQVVHLTSNVPSCLLASQLAERYRESVFAFTFSRISGVPIGMDGNDIQKISARQVSFGNLSEMGVLNLPSARVPYEAPQWVGCYADTDIPFKLERL